MAQEKEDHPKLQYPLQSGSYNLGDEIGIGVSAIVYKAECIPLNSTVAIKTIDLDQSKADLNKIGWETKALTLLSHPNILSAHCSFMVNRKLWVVMPFMSGGSLQSIISSSFPDGLSEPCISIVLKETLNALAYLHDQGCIHRDIKAGNILVDSNGCVKLADFGVSASIYETSSSSGSGSSPSSSSLFTDVTGTPYWMAPEVLQSNRGYSLKADIWSFGITALELAYGKPPLSHLPPSESLIMKITKRFRFSDYVSNYKKGGNKKFSKAFKDMVASCLDHDPAKRPTADKLLKNPFFKNCNGSPYLVRNVLQGLPSVEERFKASKAHGKSVQTDAEEEDVDLQQRSQLVKQRRISGWNFNEEEFEMVPVFPSDPQGDLAKKQVRMGGETVIPSSTSESGEEKPLTEEAAEDVSGVQDVGNLQNVTPKSTSESGEQKLFISRFPGDVTGLQVDAATAESVLSKLTKLKNSLEDQREKVMQMIAAFGGEIATEDSAEKSKLQEELAIERNKNHALELQLEFLKLQKDRASKSDEDE